MACVSAIAGLSSGSIGQRGHGELPTHDSQEAEKDRGKCDTMTFKGPQCPPLPVRPLSHTLSVTSLTINPMAKSTD